MKTYEEMARDVLRRRDEQLAELQNTSQINPPPEVVYPAAPKKWSWIPKLAIPCAAAVLVGFVGVTVWKNVRGTQKPSQNPGIAAEDDTMSEIYQAFTDRDPWGETTESIYKGGENHICINKAKTWNVYHQPLLSWEDFRPIDDDKINLYYGMDFDRLSTVFPEWESSHEPFGTYEHDSDDGFAVSHAVLSSANSINYKPDTGGRVIVTARYQSYSSASVDDAQRSVVNGFDAMVYQIPINEEFAADIEMGNVTVTIWTSYVDEYEFFRILDAYTAPPEDLKIDDNRNQTMEDKIVVHEEKPDFVISQIPFEFADSNSLDGCTFIPYTEEQLYALYGINFTCLDELHPDWELTYSEPFGIFIRDFDDIKTENMAASGGRAIVRTRNALVYRTSEGKYLEITAFKEAMPATDIEHSVVNGYDAIFFYEEIQGVRAYSAIVDMNGTLVIITIGSQPSEDYLVEFVHEYTTKASKSHKPSNPLPAQNEADTAFTAYDTVDDRISYEVDFSAQSYWLKKISKAGQDTQETDDYDNSFYYLVDFFGTDEMPVDEQYVNNLKRYTSDGHFTCLTAKGAKAYTPVYGKVVAVSDGRYNGGIGNAVAVEFKYDEGMYFILGHLDEVNVKVGDEVKPGDVLGVCGTTGAVFVEEDNEALLSIIALEKHGS